MLIKTQNIFSVLGILSQFGCGALPGSSVRTDEVELCEGYPEVALYRLPWHQNQRFSVLEGNCGGGLNQGVMRYAYEFNLLYGTAVLAARAGTVLSITVEYRDDDREHDNVIRIQHQDGTIAHYKHLREASAEVSEGEYIAVGELLGLSGSAGLAPGNSLGFAVTNDDRGIDVTIPVSFSNAGLTSSPLPEGQSYPIPGPKS